MERKLTFCARRLRLQKGFTLTEAMVVLGLIAILVGIALPPLIQWVEAAEYRASARTILSVLRETRSMAIASNLEHRVEFENAKRRFRITRGNRASDSNDWSTVVRDWNTLPPMVQMNANVTSIHMNPIGTSNAGTITIQDGSAQEKFRVRVVSTGRVRIL